MAHRNRFLYRF